LKISFTDIYLHPMSTNSIKAFKEVNNKCYIKKIKHKVKSLAINTFCMQHILLLELVNPQPYRQWRSKALRGPGSTVTWRPPFPSPPLPLSLLFPSPAPPLPRSGPQIQLEGLGERCKLPQRGLGQSPSRSRIWCILALKSVIWWQQF